MSKKDPNYVVKVEKAITEKYGEETVQHPKNKWNESKEKKYLSELKKLYSTQLVQEDYDKVEVDGVFLPKKLINRDSNRACPVCQKYSFQKIDDVYMTKYSCCFTCYVEWVEDREERWLSGWRPNDEQGET